MYGTKRGTSYGYSLWEFQVYGTVGPTPTPTPTPTPEAKLLSQSKSDGDIIVFRRPSNPDELIVQRAINKTLVDGFWYFRTQEDNASSPLAWWSGQNVEDTWEGSFHQKFLIGKVVGTIPYLGYIPLYVSAFLRTPEAMFLVIVLLCFVILLKYPSLLKKKLKPQTKALFMRIERYPL